MRKSRFLYGVLLFIMFTAASYAVTVYNEESQFSGLQFMKQIELQEKTKGDTLLLFSDIHISGTHSGNMYVIEGEISIDGIVNGDIYIYGGKIYIGETGIVNGKIRTLSSNVVYHQKAQVNGSIEPLMATLRIFIKQWDETLFYHYTDGIPYFIIQLARAVLQVIISLLFLSLSGRTVLLQGIVLINQTKDVLYLGTVIYLMGIALILLFTLSLVGFPFALLLIIVGLLFASLGITALSVVIGEWILERMAISQDVYIKFWIGIGILELIKNIPVVGGMSRVLIIPLLSLGMFAQVILNKLLNVPIAFIEETYENKFNPYYQAKLYETITRDLNRRGR